MIDSFMGPYRWLSNFWPCSIAYDGVAYPSAEHAFQAAKTLEHKERLRFAEVSLAYAIGPNMTCAEAKRAGRALKIRPDWEQVKMQVMRDVLREKFKHVDLAQKLLDTGNEALIEGNTWGDRVWGQCPVGVGENLLGRLLMEIRADLQRRFAYR